jgi:hypothetical protein
MIYSAFGLGLAVDRPIARLAGSPAAERVDVHITLGSMPAWRNDLVKSSAEVWHVRPDPTGPDRPPLLTIWKLGRDHIRLLYGDGVDFLVERRGTHIWATWPDALTPDDVSSYLLGPILGFILRLRGITCLHSSGVVVDQRAVVFVGVPGAGKSTTAAAFLARGHRVLSDDIVPLFERGRSWLARPGYPRLRLWPGALNAAGYGNALFAAAGSVPADRRHHLNLAERPDSFQREPLPLGAIYLLEERSDDRAVPFVAAIEPASALMALVANTFANTLLDRATRMREFDELGRVAASVPIRRVWPHTDATRLGQLCDVILEDFHQCAPTPQVSRGE